MLKFTYTLKAQVDATQRLLLQILTMTVMVDAAKKATTLPITITDTNVDAAKLLAVVDHENHNALVTVGSNATTLSGPGKYNLFTFGSTKVAG